MMRNKSWQILATLVILSGAALAGCAGQRQLLTPQIHSLMNPHVIALDAEDVAVLMARSGFGEDDILKLGPKLRNDLATAGGSQINSKDAVEAMFTVHGDDVYVSTRQFGTFRYSVTEKLFK